MAFPATCEAMIKAGYRRSNYSRCKGCNAPIEWWITPTNSRITMEPMPHPHSTATSHWATCPHEKDFRRKKEPRSCKPEDLQLQLLSSEPPPSVVKKT